MAPASSLPLPPPHLAARVGPGQGDDPIERYEREGRAVHDGLVALLPDDWDWAGKRVLDFGCGSARVLRHFVDEAQGAQLHGCDIDAPSIAWIEEHLDPPIHAFVNGLAPPLPVPTGSYDLVWATSVFTHIPDWSAWLAEMQRVLAPGGLLLASYLGEGVFEGFTGEPYEEDRIGLVVRKHWVEGGAGSEVLQSRWWLREHWGRAFEVLDLVDPPRDAAGRLALGHSYAVLRRLPGQVTPAELEAIRPEEPRELEGLRTSERLLRRELEAFAASRTPLAVTREVARERLRASRIAGPLRAARARLTR